VARPWRAVLAAALVAAVAAAALPEGSASAAPSPAAVATSEQPPVRYFAMGGTRELASSAQSQSIPELIALPSGDFLLGYLDGF
jgi:hypothetical protein